ncbi:MAG TPA: sigma-54 dependent transcriptional regulator [Phycisphaerae bacterium]|jgi:two-component system NtrC family response regulator/two-component system response regulator HydG|nr:sigma-54 dependent transcriptional regulator [Phycisphaerae bacterium]
MVQTTATTILIVDDNGAERDSLAQLLRATGFKVHTADSADKALSYLEENVDIVITDLRMGDLSGMDLLKHWKAKAPETMFLMVTGHGSTQTAIDAIKAGAYHYMTKPLDVDALLVMLQNMVRLRDETRKVAQLQHRLDEKFNLSNIIGTSPSMQRIFELIRRSSQAFSTVLILGESGTGKELVAEAIHQNSPRRNGPFIAVNCAAMPATLVESELFGHEKGSFTGAVDRRTGRFEAAHGGTLFIDEIGDFDISLQVKLLRVLETRSVTPVGGSKEIKVDTRVLAATSRDIRGMMAKGQFREDLYYRLNVITIELPPLRQRMEDIPLLVKRFMDRVNTQNGTHVKTISPDVIDALQKYHWPGNVRELLNIVERMIVLCDGETVQMDDLPAFIREPIGSASRIGVVNGVSLSTPEGGGTAAHVPAAPARTGELTPDGPEFDAMLAKMTLDDLENAAIASALRRFHNNRTRAAMALGISVRTLQRKVGPHAKGGDGGDSMPNSHSRAPDDVTAFAPGAHKAEDAPAVDADNAAPIDQGSPLEHAGASA